MERRTNSSSSPAVNFQIRLAGESQSLDVTVTADGRRIDVKTLESRKGVMKSLTFSSMAAYISHPETTIPIVAWLWETYQGEWSPMDDQVFVYDKTKPDEVVRMARPNAETIMLAGSPLSNEGATARPQAPKLTPKAPSPRQAAGTGQNIVGQLLAMGLTEDIIRTLLEISGGSFALSCAQWGIGNGARAENEPDLNRLNLVVHAIISQKFTLTAGRTNLALTELGMGSLPETLSRNDFSQFGRGVLWLMKHVSPCFSVGNDRHENSGPAADNEPVAETPVEVLSDEQRQLLVGLGCDPALIDRIVGHAGPRLAVLAASQGRYLLKTVNQPRLDALYLLTMGTWSNACPLSRDQIIPVWTQCGFNLPAEQLLTRQDLAGYVRAVAAVIRQRDA